MNHSIRRFRPLAILLGSLIGPLLPPIPLVATNPPQGTLHGTVVCSGTLQPLPGVTLTVLGRELSAVSGADGTFTLTPLPAGGCAVRLELGGVQPVVITDVIVKPGHATEVTLEMPLLPLIHEAVTVRPQYFASPHTLEGSRLSLASEEIRRAPGSAGDVSRIVFGLPSLAKVSDQQNILAVRGGSSYENLFLIDRIVVPNIHHFPAFGGTVGNMTLPYVDFIQDVTFLVGGFPAQFGGKSSAVMDIKYREGRRDRTAGQFTLDMGGAGAALEGPLPGLPGSWLFAARRSYFDLLTDLLDSGNTPQAMPTTSDFQGKAVVELGRRGRLTLLGLAGFDSSGLSRDDTAQSGEPYFGPVESSESTFGANWFAIWGEGCTSETVLSRSATRHRADFTRTRTGLTAFRNHSNEEQWRLSTSWRVKLSPRANLEAGGSWQEDILRLDLWQAPGTDPTGSPFAAVRRSGTVRNRQAGAHLQLHWQPIWPLQFDLGLRADHASLTATTDFSPRASLAWQVSPATTISASTGLYCQAWPLSLLSQARDPRKTRAMRAVQHQLEWRQLLADDTRLTITVYRKTHSGLPLAPGQPRLSVLDDVFAPVPGAYDDLVATGCGRAHGIEVTWQKKLKERLYGMVSGSWSRSTYRDLLGVWRPRIADNRLIFALEGGYKLDPRWEFSGRWIFAGGRPTTPINAAASLAAGDEVLDQARVNGTRLPAYRSLNLRIDHRVSFRGSNLVAYLSVWNVTNRRNVQSTYWDEAHQQVSEQLQWGILPMFGLEFEF